MRASDLDRRLRDAVREVAVLAVDASAPATEAVNRLTWRGAQWGLTEVIMAVREGVRGEVRALGGGEA